MSRIFRAVVVLCFISVSSLLIGQQLDPSLYQDMHWRLVGPFRAGRSLSVAGIAGNAHVYYFGSVGGGVWKTTDAGMSWQPIFDSQKIASIGAVAVAPSDPNVIYVGSGEADMRSDISYGNGMYKSIDAGKTWTHIGLEQSFAIGRIIVDPQDANTVYVAALGHAYAANPERGVFRSTDGGATWEKVLYKDENTGAIDLALDPKDSHIIYAALWQTRRTPWNVYPPSNGPGSGLYKSTDSGKTWQQLKNGLPAEGLGRIGIGVSPSDSNRVYAIVDAKEGGLYRSDDAGQTWTRSDAEHRIWGRGWYFGVVTVDPKNADVVYVSNTQTYKSTDGGKTFTGFKGAPGGDDYHGMWIAPEDPECMALSSDQGTVISMNGGKTWSSWYNQPTAQIYHVAADNRNPYWLWGAQQDSGAIAVPSRSDFGSITWRDERPVAVAGESGMIAPDPTDPDTVYGGTVDRYDVKTSQTQSIGPSLTRPEEFRQTWTLPIAISQADPHKMYFSHQMLFRSTNGGKTWDQISPDLTRENPGVPPNLDSITATYGLDSPRKGVIYAIAPSPLDANLVWVGTDDGSIHVTHDDGKTWKDVTPSALSAWSKVGILEASRFDKQTVYAAIDRHRLDDRRAYIYRTHDGGATWQTLGKGIPEGAYVNSVREDTVRRGLLFAGTELGIYVSFNDGDDWQTLQLNLPTASVRDMVIHGDDLAVATHGRSFWILDDISPLREVAASIAQQPAHLFKPADAYRTRPGNDQGTPLPPEIAHADNPPAGAVIDYYLMKDQSKPVVLEILDEHGNLVRRYASDDKVPTVDEKTLEVPLFWIKPTELPSAKRGMHRFVWDLHYASLAPGRRSRRRGGDILAVPGQYSIRLSVAGSTYKQPLTLKRDPNVKTSLADLQAQFTVSRDAASLATDLSQPITEAATVEKQLQDASTKATGSAAQAIKDFQQKFTSIVGPPPRDYGEPVTPIDTDHSSLRFYANDIGQLLGAVQSADAAPTPELAKAIARDIAASREVQKQWKQLVEHDLPALNSVLKQAGLPEITRTSSTK